MFRCRLKPQGNAAAPLWPCKVKKSRKLTARFIAEGAEGISDGLIVKLTQGADSPRSTAVCRPRGGRRIASRFAPSPRKGNCAMRFACLGVLLPERVRVISIARLRTLPPVHLQPIDVLVLNDPYVEILS